MFTLYVLTDAVGVVRYVGITSKRPTKRLTAHMCVARRGMPWHVSTWIRSQSCAPRILALETGLSEPDACEAEIAYIKFFRENNFPLTNTAPGGAGTARRPSPRKGVPLSAATRAKISAALLGHIYTKGISKTATHKAALSRARTGTRMNATTKNKIRAAHVRSGLRPPSWQGRSHTDATRRKMAMNAATPSRPIVETSTGQMFASIKEAGRALGVAPSGISKVLSGRRRTVRGFRFQDKEEASC